MAKKYTADIIEATSITGSLLGTATLASALVPGNKTVEGDLTVTGKITAEEFHTEYVSSSIVYQSGSTKFGDSSDDVMSVTGSLQVQGSITGSLFGTASYAMFAATPTVQGVQGTQGIQGIQGLQGADGYIGVDGAQGIQGIQGIQGLQGLQGIQGIQGTAGSNGAQGIQGIQGTAGSNGSQGTQGIQGTTGTQGIQGTQGVQGPNAGITSYTNASNNRVITSVDSSTINAESNLVFDGTSLVNYGSESREVSSYLPGSYTTDDLVSGTNYKWYSDVWRLGATRSGGASAADFVIQLNGTRKLAVSTDGNLTATGTSAGSRFGNIVIGSGTYKNTISLNGDTNLNLSTPSGAVFLDTYAQANGSFRAPIFYDSDNTGYYGNFASTSRVNGVYADYIGIGQDINTSYRLITNGSIYLNTNGNGFAEGTWKQRRGGSTFYDVIDAGNYTSYTDPIIYRGYSTSGDFQTLVSTSGTVRFDQVGATGNWSNAPGGYTYGGALSLRGANFGMQLWGSHTGDFYFKTQWNDDQYSGWRAVLHSANYNSYAPTLTGTGASGNWGINVTGTAGSISGFNNPTTAATANTIAYRDGSGDLTVRELVLNVSVQDFTPSSMVAIYPTTNQAVKVTAGGARNFLDVPTRTGGNASGNWGINVTGTAGGVAWGNVSSKPSYIMYYQGFTLDANTMDSNSTGFTYQNNAPFYGPVARFSTGGGYDMWMNGSYLGGGTGFAFRTRNGDAGTINPWRYPALYDINVNGGGALYSTIYYDQNDTTYYFDGTGGTRQSRYLTISGGGSGNYGNELVVGNTSVQYSLEDTNLRPIIQATGAYPVVSINHTVTSNGSHGATLQFTSNGVGNQFVIGSSGNGSRLDIGTSSNTSWNPHNGIDGYNGTTGLRMDTSGNIFNLVSTRSPIYYDNNDTGYYLDAASTSNFNTINVQGGVNNFNGITYFRTNNGGYLGSTDSAKLQAYSDSNNAAFMSFHKGGHYAVNFGLDADNVMRLGGWSASSNRWQLDMSGNMTVAGDVTAYSDRRVKENIVTVDRALEKVNNLRGVYYTRTDSEDKKTKLGVIAQEILEVVPEVVGQDNDGMYNVSYGNLAGLFIEAIKEQQTQIENQQTQIDELKALVKRLVG